VTQPILDEATVKRAWAMLVEPIPGMDRQRSPRQRVLIGGPLFWLVVGTFYLFIYSFVVLYIGLVLSFRLLIALIVTVSWAVAWTWRRCHENIGSEGSKTTNS